MGETMLPFAVQDQLPQNKLSGLLVAFAQGIWGQLEDGSEGFVFPEEGNGFTWAHDKNYLMQEHGVSEEALMDCIDQFEAQLGSPSDVRQRFGLMKGAGQVHTGLTVTSTLDPRIVCSYTPTSNYQSPVEGYFEWYLKDQTNDAIGSDGEFLSRFELMAGVDSVAGGDLKPELPSYEEASHRLVDLEVSESRKFSFLQSLWDLRKTIAPGYQESTKKRLMKEWTSMIKVAS